jgi:hypothetical protein
MYNFCSFESSVLFWFSVKSLVTSFYSLFNSRTSHLLVWKERTISCLRFEGYTALLCLHLFHLFISLELWGSYLLVFHKIIVNLRSIPMQFCGSFPLLFGCRILIIYWWPDPCDRFLILRSGRALCLPHEMNSCNLETVMMER